MQQKTRTGLKHFFLNNTQLIVNNSKNNLIWGRIPIAASCSQVGIPNTIKYMDIVTKDDPMPRTSSNKAPTRFERPFHCIKLEYGRNSISTALKEERLTKEDADLIIEFTAERQATRQLSDGRVNKIIYQVPKICDNNFFFPPVFHPNEIFLGVGSHKDGFWAVDYNGNYVWDGAIIDKFAGFGQTGDIPVIGDWNGDGKDKIGMEINGFWAIDYNGNYLWEGAIIDRFAGFGSTGDTPFVGDWDANNKTKIGSFKDGFWAIDYNGNYLWDGAVTDRFAGFGQTGDIPVVGKWS